MKTISLINVLQRMDELDHNSNPIMFNIKFVTADKKRMSGGEIIEIKYAKKCIGIRNNEAVFDTGNKKRKKPNHYINSTRNILCPNGQIRKIHIRLITEFNGQKVIY